MNQEDLIWGYNNYSILYRQHLDGDGRSMAEQFSRYIRDKFPDRVPFDTCFEWCAGPGFIGFALLADNICRRLVLADINPEAVALAKETAKLNGLDQCVTVYESDNLDAIPDTERFDLVVSNPPNFYCLNPLHPSYNLLQADLRPNDPGWEIHKKFYAAIAGYLNPDAVLCIEEVDPFATKCFTPNGSGPNPLWGPEPFDIRPREPIYDFREMIALGGLAFDEVNVLPHEIMPIHILVSHYTGQKPNSEILRVKPGLDFFQQIDILPGNKTRIRVHASDKFIGNVDLDDSQLWLINMLRLLIQAGDKGMPVNELVNRLNQPQAHVMSAATMLKQMQWAF